MRFTTAFIATVLVMPSVVMGGNFTFTSPSIKNEATIGNDHVLNGFGCTGGNVSPELKWSDAPKATKSFAVTIYDPDAPTGSG